MATLEIKLISANSRAAGGVPVDVADSAWVGTAEAPTLTGSSQVSTQVAPAATAQGSLYWHITPIGGKARVKMGSGTPVAADNANGGWLLLDGVPRVFAATPGDKVAFITAA